MKNSLIYSSIALIVITMETFTFFAPHILFTCQNLESMLHCGSVTNSPVIYLVWYARDGECSFKQRLWQGYGGLLSSHLSISTPPDCFSF